MIQEVYLIDNEDDIKNKLEVMFENESDYKFKKANTNEIRLSLVGSEMCIRDRYNSNNCNIIQ